jgi:thiamine-monophosphate kinase
MHETTLVGGDTCSSPKGLFISVTALGETEPSRIITRAGARPGDRLFVTGALGDAAAGLELLRLRNAECGMRNKKTENRKPKNTIAKLIEKHLKPLPRVDWGRKIALAGCASAMIDISDGLSSDLSHICEQSGVGAEILSSEIPLSPSLMQRSRWLSRPVLHYALSGGEDYELLFSVPPAKVKKLRSLRLPVTEIGTIRAGKALSLVEGSGRKRSLQPTGYDHFRRATTEQSMKKKKGYCK